MHGFSLSSGMALIFGVFHILEPGHGKTALLTYVVAKKRSWKESLGIALSSAIVHSLTVFLIAFVAHLLAHHTRPEDQASSMGYYLSMASGVIICCVGLWFIFKSSKGKSCQSHCACASHQHDSKDSKNSFLMSGLFAIAAGIIPCPTIVVAYIAGISSGNLALGLENVLLFALGMFLSLFCILNFGRVCGEKLIQRFETSKLLKLNWSLIQGVIFTGVGFYIMLYHNFV